jgi:hypothetical protein
MIFDTVTKRFKTTSGWLSVYDYAMSIGNPKGFESNLWKYVNSLGYRYHERPRTVEIDITKIV